MRELKRPYDWNRAMMEVAFTFSKLSKDPSTKVGAVVVAPDKTSLSAGYNGFPKGFPDLEMWWNNRNPDELEFCKYDLVNHAEANAILQARTRLDGWTMYVTHFPCLNCAKLIAQAGIKEVYYCLDQSNMNMSLDAEKVKRLFGLQGIKLEKLSIA